MVLSARPVYNSAQMPGIVAGPNMATQAQFGMPFVRAAAQYGAAIQVASAASPWPQGVSQPGGYYSPAQYNQPAVRSPSTGYTIVQPRPVVNTAESTPKSGAPVAVASPPMEVPLSHGPTKPSAVHRQGTGVAPYSSSPPAQSSTPAAFQVPMPGQQQQAAGAPKRSGVILCIGDSLTAGRLYSTDSYPANLESLLKEDANNSFVMKNEGIFAETSDCLLRRLQTVLAKTSRSGPLAYIFILSGTNDIFQYRTPESILANLKQIHEICASAPGSPCVAGLAIPKCAKFTPQQEGMRNTVNTGLQNILTLPAARPRFFVDLEPVAVELAGDEVHYNGKGYEEFAQHCHSSLLKLWNSEDA